MYWFTFNVYLNEKVKPYFCGKYHSFETCWFCLKQGNYYFLSRLHKSTERAGIGVSLMLMYYIKIYKTCRSRNFHAVFFFFFFFFFLLIFLKTCISYIPIWILLLLGLMFEKGLKFCSEQVIILPVTPRSRSWLQKSHIIGKNKFSWATLSYWQVILILTLQQHSEKIPSS